MLQGAQRPGQGRAQTTATASRRGPSAARPQTEEDSADGSQPDGQEFSELSGLPVREASRWREVLK